MFKDKEIFLAMFPFLNAYLNIIRFRNIYYVHSSNLNSQKCIMFKDKEIFLKL